uniref:MFS domain-containing protein n=1 Tax=Trichobilharzia regenti TaxID=157069 RepID=A0AA85JMW6_TRIRE|nr:unnamed protein product [Trichobilharzia regenti]
MLYRIKHKRKRFRLSEDISGICILMILYTLQGIPIGLSSSIPYLLQSSYYTGSYQAQAKFSLVFWPFSFKLVWAPIIDSVYSTHIGRRKTWLIPTQYAIGIELIILANYINHWLGRDPNNPWSPLGTHHPIDILSLTIAFFALTFLAATQDIAVDGWAISILSKKNLGWASTCNVVGQTIGYVIAFILFLCLESPNISNTYLRWTPVEGKGLITFSGFLYFWGVTFMVTNTLLVLFKHEKGSKLDTEFRKCLCKIYHKLFKRKMLQRSQNSNHHNHNCIQSINTNNLIQDTISGQNSSSMNSPSCEDINEDTSIIIDDLKVPPKSKCFKQTKDQCLKTKKNIEDCTELELIDRTKHLLINSSNNDISNKINHQENHINTEPIDSNAYLNDNTVITDRDNNDHDHSGNNVNANNTHSDDSNETSETSRTENNLSLVDTYRVMFGVIRLKPIWQFLILLTTVKICLTASESIFSLKLIEHGFPKERLALFGVILLPVQAILPLLITRWTNGPRPLGVFIIAFLPKLLMSSLTVPIVHYSTYFRIVSNNQTQVNLNHVYNVSDLNNFTETPSSMLHTSNVRKDVTYSFEWIFYVFLLSKLVTYSIISSIMMVVQVAFHAKISDPAVGGTYMTLLNTVSNIAGTLPNTVFLALIEPLTVRSCIVNSPFNQTTVQSFNLNNPLTYNASSLQLNYSNHHQNSFYIRDKLIQEYNATCKPPQGIKACEAINGTCVTQLDGFYLEVGLSVVFGLIVYPLLLYPMANRLDALPSSAYSFQLTGEDCWCQRKMKRKLPIEETVTECSQLSTG